MENEFGRAHFFASVSGEFFRELSMPLFGLLILLVGGVVILLIYEALSGPLRRRERAQLFLDVLAAGLKSGASAEQARERSLGIRFHLLAA